MLILFQSCFKDSEMVDSNEMSTESSGSMLVSSNDPSSKDMKLKSKSIGKIESSREVVANNKELVASTSGLSKNSKSSIETPDIKSDTLLSKVNSSASATTSLPRFGVAVPNRVFVGGIPSEVQFIFLFKMIVQTCFLRKHILSSVSWHVG